MSIRSLMLLESPNELTMGNWREYVAERPMQREEFEHFLQFYDAFWFEPEVPEHPTSPYHALLTSGQHSHAFINLGMVLKSNPAFRMLLAHGMARLYFAEGGVRPHWVVGSDTSATDLSGDVAGLVDARHAVMEKQKDKSQLWSHANEDPIVFGELVGQFEELLSTAASSLAVRDGVVAGNRHLQEVNWSPILVAVVDRSSPDAPVTKVGNSRVVSLFRYPIYNWEATECPYCQAGSVAIPPKEGNNWKLLTTGA